MKKRLEEGGGTEDATLDVDQSVGTRGRAPHPQPQLRGREQIRTVLSAMLDPADTVHQIHSPIFEDLTATTARMIWAMEDIVRMPGFHIEGRGHYRETFRLEGGTWRIASLHLTRTWLNILEGTEAGPVNASAGVAL